MRIMKPSMVWGLVISALLGAFLADALKVTVSIPELVKITEGFWLNCSHNVVQPPSAPSVGAAAYNQLTELGAGHQEASAPSSERIYSIKWYKDEEEFYRFLPSAEPKVSIYETTGITLDQTKSHEGNVYLTKAVVNTEGTYRCEVLSEAPLFETVRKSKHLRVFATPVKGPKIEIVDANGGGKSPKAQDIHYDMGDKVELRCNSLPSKPAAKLKWYVNDREVVMPGGSQQSINTTAEWPLSRTGATNDFLPASLLNGPLTSNYNVRVTPTEYRQHYKGIYSSHSSLSLTLKHENLMNGRISFKCLATMRQEVTIPSKQLIVLTPRRLEDPQMARLRARSLELTEAAEQRGDSAPRFRAQYNTRPPSAARPNSQLPGRAATPDIEFINSLVEDERQQALMYIYEEPDSTLGPSIIDGPETLERYLASQLNQSEFAATSSDQTAAANKHSTPVDFNRADNLDYVQMMRDRHSRQRSFPRPSGTNNLLGHHRRLWGANNMVQAPLYLDEFDSFRPVINWPPFDSGKLILLPPSHSIVAIPTPTSDRWAQSRHHEMKFVLPPGRAIADQRADSTDFSATSPKYSGARKLNSQPAQVSQILLERLIANLNCTSTETSIETRLSWQVNEMPLNTRDARHFPTRISPDHKQTWISIGLQQATQASSSANSLAHILGQYYPKRPVDQAQADSLRSHTGAGLSHFLAPTLAGPQLPTANEQLKIMCQATHSMLLYSSSEMITFDFNPPPDERDKLAALPSNVITAATASQTKSASSPSFANLISQGSHLRLAPIVLAATLLSVLSSRAQTIVYRWH